MSIGLARPHLHDNTIQMSANPHPVDICVCVGVDSCGCVDEEVASICRGDERKIQHFTWVTVDRTGNKNELENEQKQHWN